MAQLHLHEWLQRLCENTSDVTIRLASGRLVNDLMVSTVGCSVFQHITRTRKSVVPPRQ